MHVISIQNYFADRKFKYTVYYIPHNLVLFGDMVHKTAPRSQSLLIHHLIGNLKLFDGYSSCFIQFLEIQQYDLISFLDTTIYKAKIFLKDGSFLHNLYLKWIENAATTRFVWLPFSLYELKIFKNLEKSGLISVYWEVDD